MSIKHYLSAAAALAMFAACSDYDPGMSNEVVNLTDAEIDTIKAYTENFVKRYGEMDPNHTWGFGELAEMEEMGTRYSSPNSNMWLECIKGKVTINGNEEDAVVDFNTNGRTVPGFPVKNYYLSSDYNTESDGDDTKPVRYVAPNNPQNSQESTIDPQDYEGWYHCAFPNEKETVNGVTRPVEHWFRTKEEVISYMQRNNPSRTLYTEIIPLGDVAQFNTLTDAEVADVYAEFSKKWTGSNPQIDWDTYFVQQVWKGIATYTGTKQDGTKVSVVGGDHMDYLVCDGGAVDGNHFYNFNYSDYQLGRKGMMLIVDGNTTNFGYHSSMDNSDWYNHFRLVELHGNYYVGFDFESNGSDEGKIERDYIYNDWIVKIVPGEGTINEPDERPRTIKRRVMCEDLGSTFDFDFNDLVFDVEYTREEKKVNGEWVPKNSDGLWDATITLQAVGGTLPIYIKNFDGTEHNAHELMGGTLLESGIYSPVNVGTGSTHDPVTLTMVRVASTNPDNIVILVTSPDKKNRGASKVLELPSSEGDQNFGTSLAPQKICVPVTTRWTKEYQQIEWAYPYFHEWVNRQHGDFDFENPNDWTKKDVDTQYLFNK